MKRVRFLSLLIGCSCVPASQAALEIVIAEVAVSYGTDVRMSWSGSLNTAGVSWAVASGTSVSGGVNPAGGTFLGYLSTGSTITLSEVGMLSPGAIAFGTGSLSSSNVFSGSPFGLDGAGRVGVPAGYVSGSSLDGAIRFSNQNFTTLGLDASSGPVVWTLPSGDTITLRFQETPPPPSSSLQVISPPAGWDRVTVEDMSDDGTTVVGRLFRSADFKYQAFLWSEADGFTLVNGLAGIGDDSVVGISGDGNVVVGFTPFGTNDYRYWVYRSGVTTALPTIAGTEENAVRALSTDGAVLAGDCDTNLSPTTFAIRPAFWVWNGSGYAGFALPSVWPAVTEFQDLGWVEAVSGDGRYLFGQHAVSAAPAAYNSYRFDRVSGLIDNINSPTNLYITQSTADGSPALTYRSRSYVYLWEPGVGLEQMENRPAEGFTVYSYRAIGMSESTDRIIAFEDEFSLFGSLRGTRLVYWNADGELRSFLAMLEAVGLDLTGWTISALAAISTDGLIIAGEGVFNGVPSGFLLTLPEGALPANRVEGIVAGFFDPEDGEEVTGLTADGDGDGVPNLVEIALGVMDGGGGVTVNDPSDPSDAPQIAVEVDDPMAPQIELTAIRRRDITGLTVGMECSGDLESGWSSAGVTESVTPIDDTWEQVTFTAPAGPDCQLARLVVSFVE